MGGRDICGPVHREFQHAPYQQSKSMPVAQNKWGLTNYLLYSSMFAHLTNIYTQNINSQNREEHIIDIK